MKKTEMRSNDCSEPSSPHCTPWFASAEARSTRELGDGSRTERSHSADELKLF